MKHTEKSNPDKAELEKAIGELKSVLEWGALKKIH